MIGAEDLSLYRLTDELEEAVDEILRSTASTTACAMFARIWCSGFNSAPSETLLEEINDRFRDILIDGRFVVSGPLPEEHEESRSGRFAAAGLPFRPPQFRPAEAVDRLY